ncbi:hypothetical protein [Saccharibacillus brassicae]|uniref:hypothetical protein n=1 Tax=Saccharibacillus brassicae TaxID=2583377 RepID=UPI001478EA65|nr:hypothetical protein [Saccharibacillus brassicae]
MERRSERPAALFSGQVFATPLIHDFPTPPIWHSHKGANLAAEAGFFIAVFGEKEGA